MTKARSVQLIEKSIAAMVAAIDTYNRPGQLYREETFAILALNAWELLFKAKLLSEANNKLSTICEQEYKKKKDGTKFSKISIKRNRAGNPQTIGLSRAIGLLDSKATTKLDAALKSNIDGLIAIRDNAVHYINKSLALGKLIQELGTACLENYVKLMKDWFNRDLSNYNFYLMPLAFFRDFSIAKVLPLNPQEKNLLTYLSNLEEVRTAEDPSPYATLAHLDIRLIKGKSDASIQVQVTSDTSALAVIVRDEDITVMYPWGYNDLTDKLRTRYSDFKCNKQYHDLRKECCENVKYHRRRLLNPTAPGSTGKDFYSPAILEVFDARYTKK